MPTQHHLKSGSRDALELVLLWLTCRSIRSIHRAALTGCALLLWLSGWFTARANPASGTVTQGTASFNTSGSQMTITTSASAAINWQSFNIGAGETTTFVQPSATSVVWNQINGTSPSQILGNLNANGYVILQNQAGFYVGGQAALTAHGLVLTTASSPAPDLSSGGAWSFNAPPLGANIINYGQINITGGGSAFLIANDVENKGSISAPGGNIGLYAGESVLVSTSPNGLGLSAQVTLPQGSVDNNGKLIADGGTIIAQAQTVNQGGLVQANSVQEVNGTIEFVASDALTLSSASSISAQGDSSVASAGGAVTLKSGNTFSDQTGSTINVSGGAAGGNGGQIEISAPRLGDLQSTILGHAVAGCTGGRLTIDPTDITIDDAYAATLDDEIAGGLSSINLQADNNIEISTLWQPASPTAPGTISLTAGNNITFDDGAGIQAGNNWSVSLTAGTALGNGTPVSGSDGIYLNGSGFIQTENGNITLWAGNEVQVGWAGSSAGPGIVNAGLGSITTIDGGNLSVTAAAGDVNTGANPAGYLFKTRAPYYYVSTGLGGISTAAGGNVTINAGGDVISFLPAGDSQTTDPVVSADGGTGAFGPEPGNVSINAGGNIYGHYVLANGTGTVTAGNTIGAPNGPDAFALSLIDGTWNVNAPNGNIYLQEVRNPNGDDSNASGSHAQVFNYGVQATVNLTASDGVYLTDSNVPRQSTLPPIQVIYPPILNISAGAGGVTLGGDVTLFPSEYQNLSITTTAGGNLTGPSGLTSPVELLMSDSSQTQWNYNIVTGITAYSDMDNGTVVPVQAGNPNPVELKISGSMEYLTLITTKQTDITIGGNLLDCGFSGQNLHTSDVTSLTVGGQISNPNAFFTVNGVSIPAIPAADLLPGMGSSWDDIFTLLVNPAVIASLTIPSNIPPSQWAAYILEQASQFSDTLVHGAVVGSNPGFFYNAATGQLGYSGPMYSSVLSALGTAGQSLYVLQLVNGVPVIGADGHPLLDTVSWASTADVNSLYNASQGAPIATSLGYRIGGPGQFDITAGSISLGDSYGILSCDVFDPTGGFDRYDNLVSITPSGATLNVTVAGDLDMQTSTIAALGGGDVNVTSTGGSITLGSEGLSNNKVAENFQVGYGIFSSGLGDVNVIAQNDIEIGGSRIATYNGGNIFVESLTGSVDVGNGGDTYNGVCVSYVDPNGNANFYAEAVYGSGIVAETLETPQPGSSYQSIGSEWPPNHAAIPGNITVETPEGNITSSLGGITQEALDGNISAGPTVTLIAGTKPNYPGNVDLGQSGVIGGTVDITANGNITGLIISRQDSNINAAQNFSGSVLAGGQADVTGGGTVTGTIAAGGGADVSGGNVSADVLSTTASVNGASSQSTLGGPASASAASQSAANQSDAEAKQQLAANANTSDDDLNKKKNQPVLQRVKRVTVLLPGNN